jgi:D-ribose pyranose/furanose isomerase RbsD
METIDFDLALTKILSELQEVKIENKVLRELLVDKGIMAQEEFENRCCQLKTDLSENYLTEELGITADELRELVLQKN